MVIGKDTIKIKKLLAMKLHIQSLEIERTEQQKKAKEHNKTLNHYVKR